MVSLAHLKYFRDSALSGGIGAAAKLNRVSPSAVSQAIKSLESYFEVELLEHAKNRFILTPQGKSLLQHSHSVFSATETLEEEMKPDTGAPKGEVLFATQQSIAHYILPGFLREFKNAFPLVRPTLKIGTTDVVKTWLDNRTIEFGLSVDNFGEHDFFALPLYRGEYIFIESKTGKENKRHEKPFLLPGAYTKETKSFKSDYLKKFQKPPEIALEVKSWTIVKKLAEVGMGIGLVPDFVLTFDSYHGVKRVNFDLPKIEYSICAFYPHRKHRLSRPSRIFLEAFENYLKTLGGI